MEKISSLTYGPVVPPPRGHKKGATTGKTFEELVKNAINEVNEEQRQANIKIEEVHTKKSGLAEAMVAMEKANIALQAMLAVRNKVIEAYQEVMRMQV